MRLNRTDNALIKGQKKKYVPMGGINEGSMEISDEIIRLLLLISAYVGGYRFLTWCYDKVDYQERRKDRLSTFDPQFREGHFDP